MQNGSFNRSDSFINFNFKNLTRRTAGILTTVKSPYLCNGSTDFGKIWQIVLSVYVVLQQALMHTCVVTARCYASALLAVGLCPSVRPSVTSRSSTKTAKRRMTQTTAHVSPGTLVFWCQRSPRNSTGITHYGGTKCRWGGSKSATFHK